MPENDLYHHLVHTCNPPVECLKRTYITTEFILVIPQWNAWKGLISPPGSYATLPSGSYSIGLARESMDLRRERMVCQWLRLSSIMYTPGSYSNGLVKRVLGFKAWEAGGIVGGYPWTHVVGKFHYFTYMRLYVRRLRCNRTYWTYYCFGWLSSSFSIDVCRFDYRHICSE